MSQVDSLFKAVFGWKPAGDDIERALCTKSGADGHKMCGVCPCRLPRWACIKHAYEKVEGVHDKEI